MNRYSRGPIAADVQSEFIPLPIDFIDRQMDRRQSYYDQAKMALNTAQETWHGVQGHRADAEALENITSEYDKKVMDAVNQAGGDYSQLTAFADELGMELAKDARSGQLAGIHRNYTYAQEKMEELEKLRTEEKITNASYQRKMHEIANFGGTIERPEGGYSQLHINPANPKVDLAEFTRVMGGSLKDQFKRTGERYIPYELALNNLTKDLLGNQAAVDMARDEVWATAQAAGMQLTPEEENAMVTMFLQSYAAAEAQDLAFEQHFKPDKTAENELLSNTQVIDLSVKRGDGVTFGEAGFIFNEPVTKLAGADNFYKKYKDWVGGLWGKMTVGAALGLAAGAPSEGPTGQEIYDESPGKQKERRDVVAGPLLSLLGWLSGHSKEDFYAGAESIQNKYAIAEEDEKKNADTHARQLLAQLGTQDVVRAIAESNNIDISVDDINDQGGEFEVMMDLFNRMDMMDKAGANLRVTSTSNAEAMKDFENAVSQNHLLHFRVTDLHTGELISWDEKNEALAGHATGDAPIKLGGKVMDPGQSVPMGNVVGSYFKDGEVRFITWSPQAVDTRDPNFQRDRVRAAINFGIASYKEGNDVIQLVPNSDRSVVTRFRNGKEEKRIPITGLN